MALADAMKIRPEFVLFKCFQSCKQEEFGELESEWLYCLETFRKYKAV